MKQHLVHLVVISSLFLFSAGANAADTYAFVTQASNGSTLAFLNPLTGKQFSGRALGINALMGATYSADGSLAFVTDANGLVAYSVPGGKHLGTTAIPNGTFGVAAAIPGTANLLVSVRLFSTSAIYEVDGATFTAKPVFQLGRLQSGASALAVSPDGGTLYLSTGSALISVSTITFQQTASVLIGGIDRIAVTPDGGLLLLGITNVSPNIVAEYNPRSKAVIGSVPSDSAAYIAISPDGSSFYTTQVPNNFPIMLEQVSIATLAVLNSVAIPTGAFLFQGNPFAISPDGSKLAIFAQAVDPEIALFTLPSLTPGPITPVGNACGVAFPTAAFVSVTNCGSDTADIVDITSGTVKARYDAGPSPQHTLTNSSGSVLYVSNLYGVWALSTKTGKILTKVEFPGPYIEYLRTNGQLALSADGSKLFAQNLSGGVLEIATSNGQLIGLVPGVPPGLQISAIATSPDGKYLFVSGESELLLLNQSDGTLISTVSTLAYGTGIVLLPSNDSANLYIEANAAGFISLYKFNVASQSVTNIPSQVNGALALSPDGKTLYVAGGAVEAIDTATLVFNEIPSPVPATGIAVTPDGSKLVVTSGEPKLGVITIVNPLIGATIPIGAATGAISLR